MILTILRIMYLRLRNNPVELLLVFVMPVAFFSIFAAIFSNGMTTGSETKLRVGWIVQHPTTLASQLRDFLEQNSALECYSLIAGGSLNDRDPVGGSQALSDRTVESLIAVAQRTGRYDLIIRLPRNFPETISAEAITEPCPIHLVTDGQNPMAVAMVTSVIKGFIAQKQSAWVAEQLINSSFLEQQSVGNALVPSSELPPRFGLDDPSGKASKRNHRPGIEPLTEPTPKGSSPHSWRETGDLDPERNPRGVLRDDFHTSGLLAEADRSGSSSAGLGRASDAAIAPLLSPIDEREHLMPGAIRFPSSPYVSSLDLLDDGEERRFGQETVGEYSMKSPAVIAVSQPVSDPQSKATAAKMPDTFPATQPIPAGRDVLQIQVKNPQSARQENPRIAMYAAGIAVLFLLFSSTGNAATLLEEAESGTLDRIMVSKAQVFHIIIGKWLGIFLLGMVQISIMFLWAEWLFQIQLWKHLDGFFVMTCCTSAATASLAMLMATLCNSRTQLNAISVVLILSMSAMGGSMIPRFVMSDRMKEIGQWTFNAWALDGYQKVFWYQAPLASLRTEVTVLLGSAVVMGGLAFIFAQRWKHA